MLSAPESKNFCYYFEKVEMALEKSYTFTVIMSVKTWWACLDLSLSIIVFDECVSSGSVRIQTGMFRINTTGATSCCTNYREWQLSALLVFSCWAMANADFCFGTCQKSDHKFFCSPYRPFLLSPEIVCLKLVCLCKRGLRDVFTAAGLSFTCLTDGSLRGTMQASKTGNFFQL